MGGEGRVCIATFCSTLIIDFSLNVFSHARDFSARHFEILQHIYQEVLLGYEHVIM